MSESLKDEWVFVETHDSLPTCVNPHLFRKDLEAALPEAHLYDDVSEFNPGTYVASTEEIAEAVKSTLEEARHDMEHHPERLPK